MKLRRLFPLLGLLTAVHALPAQPAAEPRAQALLTASLGFCERLWDERAGLL